MHDLVVAVEALIPVLPILNLDDTQYLDHGFAARNFSCKEVLPQNIINRWIRIGLGTRTFVPELLCKPIITWSRYRDWKLWHSICLFFHGAFSIFAILVHAFTIYSHFSSLLFLGHPYLPSTHWFISWNWISTRTSVMAIYVCRWL